MRSRAALRIGGGLTVALLAAAALSWFWTPWPPGAIDLAHRLAPPSASHLLGTDAYGRDVLSLLLAGARSSIGIGAAAVAIGLAAGTALGVLAAVAGGWTEELVMRVADVAFAFPAILTAIMLAAVIGPGAFTAVLAIGGFAIPVFARVARAQALAVLARDFVLAARAAGRGPAAIAFAHVLPNIAPVLIVQASLQFALAILAEAALSYLGLGTQPPQPSWGRMLSEAQTLLYTAPLLAVYPGVAIALAVLGLNLLGDGLRDALDPRLARAR